MKKDIDWKADWFTSSLWKVVQKLKSSSKDGLFSIESLAISIFQQENRIIDQVLVRNHIPREFLISELKKLQPDSKDEIVKSRLILNDLIQKSLEIADEIGEPKISFRIFLQATLNDQNLGLTKLLVDSGIHSFLMEENHDKHSLVVTPVKEEISKVLDFCVDLSGQAELGNLDPAFNRESEVASLTKILNRYRKNNALIVGEPGVGKTALVHEFANRLNQQNVPPSLVGVRIISLEYASLMAGTAYTGELEKKLKLLMEALVAAKGKIILFVDEFHAFAGIGRGESPLNAINIFKPYLLRGDFKVIGATTHAEYRKYLANDEALTRRFETITVEEPSIAECLEIIKKSKKTYEMHYGIKIPDNCCKLAVELSSRYIQGKKLPDKALDLIDLACSENQSKNPGLVSELMLDDIYQVVESKTKVPASFQRGSIKDVINNLEHYLKKELIGQRQPIKNVSKILRRNFVFPDEDSKPIGSFLFLGPTGVGKTEFAKLLAKKMFFSEKSLIRIDMSELSQANQVARLIGSPPGYVGFEQGGFLTNAVTENPYSLILIDEFEKAHPDVFPIFLQILDDGRLTDGKGRTVLFNNCILIGTSNIKIEKQAKAVGLGFGAQPSDNSINESEDLRKHLAKIIPPELVNRFDGIMKFDSLGSEELKDIVSLKLQKLTEKFSKKNVALKFDKKFIESFSRIFVSGEFGARQVSRLIGTEIEDPILDQLFQEEFTKKITFQFSYREESVRVERLK